MANKSLFGSKKKVKSPVPFKAEKATTVNEAGGAAYSRSDKEALAQLVMTGFLGDAFYSDAKAQLDQVLELAKRVDTKFLAQLAVEARVNGYMKDTPALLCAVLTTRGDEGRNYLRAIFNRVIDNGKMLRNFVQILRSGQVGRKSLGTAPKNLVRSWFNTRDNDSIFRNSVGNDPSMADVIKMVHPRPNDKEREALYAYIIGKEPKVRNLPPIVKRFEAIKESGDLTDTELKNIPMEMLSGLEKLSQASWVELAKNMSWTQLRMNLNTLARHGVFNSAKMVTFVADKLRDKELIAKSKVYPYQLFTAIKYAGADVPREIHRALEDALDISLDNIPDLEGKNVYVFPDVSGSMDSPVTGQRPGATSVMRCVDVAGLFAAALRRKGATVWAIDTSLHKLKLGKSASVADVAQTLAAMGGGGTDLPAPMAELNKLKENPDLIVYFSDNESWADRRGGYYGHATGMMDEFKKLKDRSPTTKLICVDLQPYGTSQAHDAKDILKVGGFSDRVFDVISDFLQGRNGKGFWVSQIEKTEL